MAIRFIAPLAGASLLVLAQAASAQEHSHHPAPQTQPSVPGPTTYSDTHAGHDMSRMQVQPATMDHSGHTMTSPLGPWPMSRDASGTSWQPDAGRHAGVHWSDAAWTFMGHALLNLTYTGQNGPRGDDQTFVSGMIMGAARRDFADGSTLNLRLMASPDPFMGKSGYPLLLAAGETADGINPLIDRQHPHELIMEASAKAAQRREAEAILVLHGQCPSEVIGAHTRSHRRGQNRLCSVAKDWIASQRTQQCQQRTGFRRVRPQPHHRAGDR